ncbi:interferon-induced protein with tetratricopeptide repeats 1 [Physeter macrocephalus]|uniref:Interferon-induced protein with tetratricopeptide repeats 1 n=1 Tax=Physeter macrocephalus TaxID=9755 RepID=A0A2Y9SE77_PHYMC|nr:interferon-induced protein with tetratricopeptide repeats 1 [Physeter catodon]XP_023976995.1 interferon-induced protein with tetratricopeptide repeats 1 [Physeter catodon]XP_023976996.1 interferon-induced protein with tetratricopeptide repeats 1 [Physeter catodon]|eukprot:XP_023976994.1 interferon-induced protein with tetratricopeptide repeats 1 [Physeter catodon]
MSNNADGDQLKDKLEQLRCHFTWELVIEDTEIADLENRVLEQIEFLDTKYNVGIYTLLAYVKHLRGQNEEALKSLKEAEDLTQQEHDNQSDVRSLVTWGNYAWLHYHMGRHAEAQIYLDEVKNTCRKLANSSSYRIECPQMDCEEGWALLKCGGENYERAKVCFEKALEVDPENPEFSTGYAITVYRLQAFNKPAKSTEAVLNTLKQAVRLNPEDAYMKSLLALQLQGVRQEAQGEKYIKEALTDGSSKIYVFRHAAKFYRKKGSTREALQFLKLALKATPSSVCLHHQMGLCYKLQMIRIKRATNGQPKGQDKENINRIIQSAISHFEFAVQQKPTFEFAYIDLAEMYTEAGDHQKAEDVYQKVLCMESLNKYMLQQVHFHYGQFLEFQKKSEVDAISHYLKAVKIENASLNRDKSIYSLKKLALKKLQRDASDIESLYILGFIHKVKGEMNEALEYYEQALRLVPVLENSVLVTHRH